MEILKVAEDYARRRGWQVFPVHGVVNGKCTCGKGDCGSIGKHPAIGNGLKGATTNLDVIRAIFTNPMFNIAVATGQASGFWALDIDGMEGEESLRLMQENYGDLPATLMHYTGKGKHLLFTWPGKKVPNSVKRLGEGIDVRGDGGYIVVAPSVHASGRQYQFANPYQPIVSAPEWLVSLICDKPKPTQAPTPTYAPEWSETDEPEVRDMLSCIDPDCDYETWVSIGMGLHAGGWSAQMWDQWSRGSSKYKAGECFIKWKGFNAGGEITFATVAHFAMQGGWKPKVQEITGHNPALAILDNYRQKSKPTAIKPVPAPQPSKGLPFDPMSLPGVIGDTVRWIVRSAPRPQPELSFLAVITVLGAIFSRHYASPTNLRTNLYTIGILETGGGKDHPRKQMKRLLIRAGMSHLLSGDAVISGAGILKGLQKQPAQVMMLDELGMMIKAMSHENAPPHLQMVKKIIVELFSSANSTYHSGHYAGKDVEPVILECPALSIFGTTNSASYTKALTSEAISEGQLNRFIVIESPVDLPEYNYNATDHEPSEALVQAWSAFANLPVNEATGNLAALNLTIAPPPVPNRVMCNQSVMDEIRAINDWGDNKARKAKKAGQMGVWTRYGEQIVKVAMIMAISRNHLVPEVTQRDLEFARSLIDSSCNSFVSIAEDQIADSPQERYGKQILKVIRDAGEAGITKTALHNATRSIPSKDRKSILDDLVTQRGLVSVEVTPGVTKKLTSYKMLDISEDND